MDIYIPPTSQLGEDCKGGHEKKKAKAPVFIFVTGGAWMIGYKAWGALFGKVLAQCGVLVVAPDYRNFPQGCVSDMISDVDTAVQWTLTHIESYGGDSKDVYLCGHGSGAHIIAMLLINKAMKVVYSQPFVKASY